ncbi:hypothetical protein SLE2022_128970 [Rubroshorea leprosula]
MAEPTATTATRPLKVIAGADSFGAELKDAMVAHLRSLNIDVEDLGTTSYYNVGAEVGRRVSSSASADSKVETRGLLACGTGVGVAIFANKFPGVYATTCANPADAHDTRSINNCNVLALSGKYTPVEKAVEILTTWLDTPFKSPCPASGSQPWPQEIADFFDQSLVDMPKIGAQQESEVDSCAICCLVKNRELNPIDMIPGGSMKILRESPTSAFVRFKAGSVEPAHHHTFGHDLVVTKGKKSVWNLTKEARYDLVDGDYLFTPAGDVHRVKYYEDTEFFIKWDGHWDMFFDEDLETAKSAIEKELANGV